MSYKMATDNRTPQTQLDVFQKEGKERKVKSKMNVIEPNGQLTINRVNYQFHFLETCIFLVIIKSGKNFKLFLDPLKDPI
jgi:hypothetical protein